MFSISIEPFPLKILLLLICTLLYVDSHYLYIEIITISK